MKSLPQRSSLPLVLLHSNNARPSRSRFRRSVDQTRRRTLDRQRHKHVGLRCHFEGIHWNFEDMNPIGSVQKICMTWLGPGCWFYSCLKSRCAMYLLLWTCSKSWWNSDWGWDWCEILWNLIIFYDFCSQKPPVSFTALHCPANFASLFDAPLICNHRATQPLPSCTLVPKHYLANLKVPASNALTLSWMLRFHEGVSTSPGLTSAAV